jgi:YD repeat-containing protein
MSGSNPWQVRATDPFHNLTVYEFNWTEYAEGNGTTTGTCYHGECANSWFDGLLSKVSTYVGPEPENSRLVQEVTYNWDADQSAGSHKMFHYHQNWGGEHMVGLASPPATANSMAVNAHQVDTHTYTPGSAGNSGHTVTIELDDFTDGYLPMQHVEYLDGEVYRTTHTEYSGVQGNVYAHKWVQVSDAAGNLVSRVDRKFDDTNGRLLCEVNRIGNNYVSDLGNCSSTSLHLNPGDAATVNSIDANTGSVLTTTSKGGDDASIADRTVTMSYLSGTSYLRTKNYGFLWDAVSRKIDFNTGLTYETHDAAGNTTTYSWDALGRLTQISPGGIGSAEAPTQISYPSVLETQVRQHLDPDNYIQSVYLYDDLGRNSTVKRRNAGGGFDMQKTQYDIAGRVTKKSEWGPDGTADAGLKWTAYDYTSYVDPNPGMGMPSNYPDPLGRVHGVTTPDDPTPTTPTTETTYDGAVTTVRIRDVQGWSGSSATNLDSVTVYTRDALGRLIAVDSPGTGADAGYAYDADDNLIEVRLTNPSETSQVQVRRFDYDLLGRVRVAANPETRELTLLQGCPTECLQVRVRRRRSPQEDKGSGQSC